MAPGVLHRHTRPHAWAQRTHTTENTQGTEQKTKSTQFSQPVLLLTSNPVCADILEGVRRHSGVATELTNFVDSHTTMETLQR